MKKTIFVKGPFLSQSGYGEQARFALRALRSRPDLFDVLLHPINWGQTGWVWEDSEFRRWVDERVLATQVEAANNRFRPDMTLQITIPNEFQRMSPIDIGYTAGIETTKVSGQWLQKGNEMQKIIVVSNHAKTTFENTTVMAKDQNGNQFPYSLQASIETVAESTPRVDPEEVLGFELPYDNNFLVVSQMGVRKNFPDTIRSFVEEFQDEEVGLVVKTNYRNNCMMDRDYTQRALASLLKDFPERKCKVHLLHGDLSAGQMTWLYNHDKINALVNIAHGEGYGLPLFEAAREGMPIVTVGWSGQLDFLHHDGTDYFEQVDYTLQDVQREAVWENVVEPDSKWAYADLTSYRNALRNVLRDPEGTKQRATELKSIIETEFSDEKLYEAFCNAIMGKSNLEAIPVEGISFCIPTNGAKPEETKMTIRSIKKQMSGFPHEIVIAGDIEKFKDIEGVILVDKKEEAHSRKVATLRNAAGDNSKYETIAWCDDDVIIGEEWLTSTLDYSKSNGWNVLGNIVHLPDGSRYWDRSALNPHRLVDYSHPDYDKSLYQSSAFFLTRRSVFEKVRWDDNCLVYADREGGIPEDIKYSIDLKENGYELSFNDSATVWHNDDTYTEFNNGQVSVTLKKDVLREKMDMHFFLPSCDEYDQLKESLNE